MKILEITTDYVPNNISGAEILCFRLVTELKERHQLVLATPINQEKIDGVRNFKLIKIRNKYLRKLFFDYYNPINEWRIKKIIREVNPDVIHAHNLYGYGYRLLRACSRRRPTCITAHDYWPIDYDSNLLGGNRLGPKKILSKLHSLIVKYSLKDVLLIAPSAYMANQLEQRLPNKIICIRNGIEINATKTSLEKLILYVGRLTQEKGLHIVLPIVREVFRDIPGWEFKVLGDGPLLENLRMEWPEFSFEGHVNPDYLMSKASVLLMPSVWPENCPNVILEARNLGVPVVANAIGGIPELIQHGINGYLYNSEDELKAYLKRILENDKLAIRMHHEALKLKKDIDIHLMVDKYVKCFREVV